MNNRDLVIGIDCSTTASKVLVMDRHGKVIASARRPLALFKPQTAWHEQDAEDWWNATANAIKEACSPLISRRLAALCITMQRETFVLVDKKGQPLRNAVVWMDERARSILPELEGLIDTGKFHRITGKPLSGNLSVSKIYWLKHYEPKIFRNAYRFLDVSAFLNHRLTGQYGTSMGCADPMGLFDMQNQCWSDEILSIAGIRHEQMPQVYPIGAILGNITPHVAALCGLPAGLPVVAGIGDGQAAGIGMNIIHPGEAYLNLGTAVVTGTYTANYVTDRAFRTTFADSSMAYYLETVLLGGAYIIRWFIDHYIDDSQGTGDFSAEDTLDIAAQKVSPGSQGLILLPYWNSVMNPYWDAAASGAVVGWRGFHQKAHLYRAILEGIAFELRLHLEGVEAAINKPIERLLAVGGGTRSNVWLQIIADITGKQIHRVDAYEASALGAGIIAAASSGLFPDLQKATLAMVPKIGKPLKSNPQHQELYNNLYQKVYRHLYPALQSSLRQLADLTNPHI